MILLLIMIITIACIASAAGWAPSDSQLARDVGGVNVRGVKGMLFGIKRMYCTKLCVTCVFPLQDTVFYITFAAPTSTLPTSLLKQGSVSGRRSVRTADVSTTANLPTNIVDFGGFDSSIILI